jgi:hypothetical protein
VDDHELRPDRLERRGDRFRAGLAAGDDPEVAAGEVVDVPARRSDHDRPNALRGAQRVQRPVEHPPTRELDEGLGAAGSEPLSGAGGRDDRCS